jgi:hypothetical protein
MDVRVQQRIGLPHAIAVDLIGEVFNVFNSPNWTVSTQESRADFGTNIAGQFRSAQLGFRVTF